MAIERWFARSRAAEQDGAGIRAAHPHQRDVLMMKENPRAEHRLISLDDHRSPLRGTVWVASSPASGRAARPGSPSWASREVPITGREPRRARANRPALLTMVRRIIAALRLWRERARSREQLRECNDYLLRDIGLRREQVCYEYPKPYSHCD